MKKKNVSSAKKVVVALLLGLVLGYGVRFGSAVLASYLWISHYNECVSSSQEEGIRACVDSYQFTVFEYVGYWQPNIACIYAEEESKWIFCQ